MVEIGSRTRNQPAPPWLIFDDLCDPHRQPTDLRWTLYVDEPLPESTLTKHMFQRICELINANLRYSYGQ